MQKNIIGVDLGATSGRVILARAGGDRLRMEELHRFPNRMREIDGRFYWDIHALYEEILRGLSVAGGRGERIDSIGIDTWGVDFACVDPDGDLLGLPRAYRDPYTDGVPEEFFRTVPRESVYAKTGIQVMNFNSLYQLYALNREQSPVLAAAEHVLFMPDALSYLLTGEQVCEYTILSTSQLMNPRTRELDGELLRAVGVDASLFARRVMPASVSACCATRWRAARDWGVWRSSPWRDTIPLRPSPPCPLPTSASPISRRARGRSWASSCPLRSSRRSRAR